MVDHELRILLMDALVVQEVRHLDEVHAHLDHLLDEHLLALPEEVDLLLAAAQRPLLRELLLNLALAFLGCRHRHNVALFEEVEQLAWNLFKSLLCQLGWVILEVTEGYELHNIGLHILLVTLRVEWHLISIENIHALEIIRANTYNND